jgi:hypothetical protein
MSFMPAIGLINTMVLTHIPSSVCLIHCRRESLRRLYHLGDRHARVFSVRSYSGTGAKELFDLLTQRKADVEALIRGVTGFAAYTLVQTADGGISVTVCQDKAGADESLQRAREWIQANASGTGVGAPTVSEGSVILQLS